MTFFVKDLTIARGAAFQVRRVGGYQGLADALVAAERIISEILEREFGSCMEPGRPLLLYTTSGEALYVYHDNGDITPNLPDSNHFRIALARCAEIAGEYQPA